MPPLFARIVCLAASSMFGVGLPSESLADSAPPSFPFLTEQSRRTTEERQENLSNNNSPALQAHSTESPWKGTPPAEKNHCFQLDRVEIKFFGTIRGPDTESIIPDQWRTPQGGFCLGAEGIGWILQQVDLRLRDLGYIGAQVTLPEQDLRSRLLQVQVQLSTVTLVQWIDSSGQPTNQPSGLSNLVGESLNIRAIEQFIETIESLPGHRLQAQVLPNNNDPTAVELTFEWQRASPTQGIVFLDDSGDKVTGRYVTGAQVTCSGCLSDLDLVTMYYQTAAGTKVHTENHSDAWSVQYSIPTPIARFSAGTSHFKTRQIVPGFTQDYRYITETERHWLGVADTIRRTRSSITSADFQLIHYGSRNFIDDLEVDVQRRITSSWLLKVKHREVLSDNESVLASIEHEKGIGWLNAQPAPEEAFGEGTSRFQLQRMRVQYNKVFGFLEHTLIWNSLVYIQTSQTALSPQQRVLLGGRNDVRGFRFPVIQGDRGGYIRNELSLPIPSTQIEAYLGADVGYASGPSSIHNTTHSISGGTAGFRLRLWNTQLESFLSRPLRQTQPLYNSSTIAGFNLILFF